MSTSECGTVRERLPDWVGGRLADADVASVDRHLASCSECRAEADLIGLLYASRPEAPSGLEARVQAAVRKPRGAVRRPWWALSAAAVAAVALGIGVTSDRVPETDSAPAYAVEVSEGDLWSSDDGLLAGAPSLEALSDDDLLQLLDELDVGRSGGAA